MSGEERGTLSGAFLLAFLDAVPTCWAQLRMTPEQIDAQEERAEQIAARMKAYIAERRAGDAPPG